MKKVKIKNGISIKPIFYNNRLLKWTIGFVFLGSVGAFIYICKMIYCEHNTDIEFATHDWIGFGVCIVVVLSFVSLTGTLYFTNTFVNILDTIIEDDEKSNNISE